jgi:hypothetical protein
MELHLPNLPEWARKRGKPAESQGFSLAGYKGLKKMCICCLLWVHTPDFVTDQVSRPTPAKLAWTISTAQS